MQKCYIYWTFISVETIELILGVTKEIILCLRYEPFHYICEEIGNGEKPATGPSFYVGNEQIGQEIVVMNIKENVSGSGIYLGDVT